MCWVNACCLVLHGVTCRVFCSVRGGALWCMGVSYCVVRCVVCAIWGGMLCQPPNKGLPYIPRVHLSEGSLVRSPLKWLCSEEPMVRRSFIPKFLYSESCYVPKIPYSGKPSTIWILCYEDSLVRSSSSPKGAMFQTSIFRKSPLPPFGSILRRSFSPKFPQFQDCFVPKILASELRP